MTTAPTGSLELASFLARTIATQLPLLRAIPDDDTKRPNRPSGVGWSRREELGHLIDSAVNNHCRFVVATSQPAFTGPGYEQEHWVAAHRYRDIPWTELVDVWHAHNRILVPVVAAIPDASLATPCTIDGDMAGPLCEVIDSYVLHMQHHLDQILRRSPVTKYPREKAGSPSSA